MFLPPPIVHTLAELKMTGNCLKGSRPLLSFDPVSSFQMSFFFLFKINEMLWDIEHVYSLCNTFIYLCRNLTRSLTMLYWRSFSHRYVCKKPAYTLNTLSLISGRNQHVWEADSQLCGCGKPDKWPLHLLQTFSTPRYHPKSQPFVDHVFTFTIADNRIWFRNYQVIFFGHYVALQSSFNDFGDVSSVCVLFCNLCILACYRSLKRMPPWWRLALVLF